MSTVAVIGLGEAGSIYARAFAACGHDVIGFDPAGVPELEGVRPASSGAEAAAEADAVVVLTGAVASPAVAADCLPALRADALYIDLTSSSPGVMKQLAEGHQGFVDGAILGAVIDLREKTPLIVSGPQSARAAELLAGLGTKVTDVAGAPGDATAHKLIRSVTGKGLAAVVCEAMEAARAAGLEEWMRGQVAALLPGGLAAIDRYESGTRKHAARRAHEVDDVVAYLEELGAPSGMTRATAALHHRYADEGGPS